MFDLKKIMFRFKNVQLRKKNRQISTLKNIYSKIYLGCGITLLPLSLEAQNYSVLYSITTHLPTVTSKPKKKVFFSPSNVLPPQNTSRKESNNRTKIRTKKDKQKRCIE